MVACDNGRMGFGSQERDVPDDHQPVGFGSLGRKKPPVDPPEEVKRIRRNLGLEPKGKPEPGPSLDR